MIKYRIATLCLLLITTLSFAQSDASAVKLLKSVSQKYASYKTMSMDVSFTIENLESKTKENRKGQALIKGNKFSLNLDKQQIICDNKTIWTYLKDANEVQVNTFDPKQEMMTPDKIFSLAEKDFICYLGEKVNEGGKSLQIIELTPIDKKLNFSKIKLFVDLSDNTVKKGIVLDKSAIHFTYSISNFIANKEIADTNFAFDKSKFPGVEVIDLR